MPAKGSKLRTPRPDLHGPYFGKMVSCKELAKMSGINRNTIHSRIKRGWFDEDLVRKPLTNKEILELARAAPRGPYAPRKKLSKRRIKEMIHRKKEEQEFYDLPFGHSLIRPRA